MDSTSINWTAEAVVTLSREGIIATLNPAAALLFGYDAGELIGREFRFLLDPGQAHEFSRLLKQLVQAESDGVGKWRLSGLRRDGSSFPMGVAASRVCAEGRATIVGILRDLTKVGQIKALSASESFEGQPSLARKRPTDADQARSELLVSIGHEMRTSLNIILGALGLLLKTRLSHEQLGFVDTANQSSKTLFALIEDILDFSKIEAGLLELRQDAFDVVQLVESVAEDLASLAQDRRMEIATVVSPAIPRWLNGDPGRLRPVLLNLVETALKFTPTSGVAISVSTIQEDAERLKLRFELRDTGSGCSEVLRRRLFDPFCYADPVHIPRHGQTGLGLIISRCLLVMMGGDMVCRSQVDQSSTFWFSVDCAKLAGRSAQTGFPSLQGLRVLIVEGNRVSRAVREEQLRAWGMEATAVDNGSVALANLREAQEQNIPFTTVLIDQELADGSGEEFGSEMLRLTPDARPRLVLMSNLQASSVSARVRRLGFSASLTKPIRQSSLYRWLCIVNDLVEGDDLLLKREDGLVFRDAPSARGGRILLAEDSEVSQIVITAMLEKAGYRVDAVSNGLEVLQALRIMPYELVLMDVTMPELDGFEAAVQVRQLAAPQSRIPIIGITADNPTGIRERCFAAGMDDCLGKPIDQVQLLALLERWLAAPAQDAEKRSESALDWQTLSQLEADTDRTVLDRAINLFLTEATARLSRIAEAHLVRDWPRVKKEAHALKSSAGTFGARRLYQHALRLNEACRQSDWETALALSESIAEVAAPELEMLACHYGYRR
jgi:two-component system sensor histidine kinase/response regulator